MNDLEEITVTEKEHQKLNELMKFKDTLGMNFINKYWNDWCLYHRRYRHDAFSNTWIKQ